MSQAVREMFSSIAGAYDRANTVLSLGIHHRWRRRMMRLVEAKAGERLLDVCSGTGDVALALREASRGQAMVIGTDFSEPMLRQALRKDRPDRVSGGSADEARRPDGPGTDSRSSADGPESARVGRIPFLAADALRLPFADASFDGATIAFGIRNVDDPIAGLRELRRVLKPGGRAVVLEFGQPDGPLFGPIYGVYTRRVLPHVGHWVTGRRSAYEYLQRTAAAFPAAEAFASMMRQAGFANLRLEPLTFGIAYLYRGDVEETSHAARA